VKGINPDTRKNEFEVKNEIKKLTNNLNDKIKEMNKLISDNDISNQSSIKKSSNKKKSGLKLVNQDISSPIDVVNVKKKINFNDTEEEHKITDNNKNNKNKIENSVYKFLNSNYYKDDINKTINKIAPDNEKYKNLDNFLLNDIKNKYTKNDLITLIDLN